MANSAAVRPYYLHMFGLALLVIVDPRSLGVRLAALVYSGIGLLCSIGFELFQFFVIGALCMYCGISALTTLLLFSTAVWHWRTNTPQKLSAPER